MSKDLHSFALREFHPLHQWTAAPVVPCWLPEWYIVVSQKWYKKDPGRNSPKEEKIKIKKRNKKGVKDKDRKIDHSLEKFLNVDLELGMKLVALTDGFWM